MSRPDAILHVDNLTVSFGGGAVTAVSDASFAVAKGETFAIVGESGSGKSVTALSILGLIERPGRITAGAIRFKGRDLRELSEPELRGLRGSAIAIVFQDPMTTLHPLLRIEEQMVDAILAHRSVSRSEARRDALAALGRVGISAAAQRLRAYPHQLSGGMRQRIAIAIAMLNSPELIVADEPTTALDVTTQAQIIREMQDLCRADGTALVWITHDLAVVSEIADRVAVMYAGSVVESGPAGEVLASPAHPYTAGLLGSIPSNNAGARRLAQIPGNVQSGFDAPGCRFAPRCSRRLPGCDRFPVLSPMPGSREVRCLNPLLASEAAA